MTNIGKELFPKMCAAIAAAHAAAGIEDGPFPMALSYSVARFAHELAEVHHPDLVRLAVASALCRNARRIIEKVQGVERADPGDVEVLVASWLDTEDSLTPCQRAQIIRAVQRHSGPNDMADSMLDVVLKDAHRLAHLCPIVVVRATRLYENLQGGLQVLNYDGREGTFKDPPSIIDDLRGNLVWAETKGGEFSIRLPHARALARHLATTLRNFIDLLIEEEVAAGNYVEPIAK